MVLYFLLLLLSSNVFISNSKFVFPLEASKGFGGDQLLTYELAKFAFGDELVKDIDNLPYGIDKPKHNTRRQLGLIKHMDWTWQKHTYNSSISKYVIPYSFDTNMEHSTEDKIAIRIFLDEFENQVNTIKFIERELTDMNPYINITANPENGCRSYVGLVGTVGQPHGQELNLAPGCVHSSIVKHEFLHALGVFHEQCRPDRDMYVLVNKTNILPGFENNFDKLTDYIDSRRTEYDIHSIMHYSAYTFSNNGQPTMTNLNNSVSPTDMGNAENFTENDIEGILLLYPQQDTVSPSKQPTKTNYIPSSSPTLNNKNPTISPTTKQNANAVEIASLTISSLFASLSGIYVVYSNIDLVKNMLGFKKINAQDRIPNF